MSNATELLRRAQEFLKYPLLHVSDNLVWPRQDLFQDIENFLAAEPEADKPAAWMHPVAGVIQTRLTGLERDTYTIPLYTRPEPARKPMTEEEMRKGSGEWAHLHNIFEEGIRYAEKHHFGVGEDNE